MNFFKKNYSADVRAYTRNVKKLVKMYRIATGLSSQEFIDRFWNKKIIQLSGVFESIDAVDAGKIAYLRQIKPSLDEDVIAYESMAIALHWPYYKACRYLLNEIFAEMINNIRDMEKSQDALGNWKGRGKLRVFKHPIYERGTKI